MIAHRGFIQILSALLHSDRDSSRACLQSVDIGPFVGFCREQQIAGTVYCLIRSIPDLAESLPWDLLAPLKESYLTQWTRNERYLQELLRLKSAADAAGIEFVVLKGLPLAQRYHGDIDRREMYDLDILVRRDRFGTAAQMLEQQGYASAFRYSLSEKLDFVHGAEFNRGDYSLDLHYALRIHPSLRIAEDDIWSSRGTCRLGNEAFGVLSDDWALASLLLSIHNDINRGVVTFRALVDLFQLLGALGDQFDWHAFQERGRRDGSHQIAVNVLAVFLTLFPDNDGFAAAGDLVTKNSDLLVVQPDYATCLQLLDGGSTRLRRNWALRQYESGLGRNLTWWLVNKPLFYMLCDREFLHRLRDSIKRRRNRQTADETTAIEALPDVPTTALDEVVLRFGSLTTRFRFQRRAYVDLLEDLFRIKTSPIDAAAAPPRFDAEIRMFDVLPGQSGFWSWQTPGDRRNLIVHHYPLEGSSEIYYHNMAARITRADNRWQILVPVLSEYEDRALLMHCIMVLFYRILYQLERIHLHAAAVVVNDQTSIFIGHNGSGKSTLSLKLGFSGGTVLAEDHVVVRRSGEGYSVSGCDGNMRLTRKTEQYFFPDGLPLEPIKIGEVMKKEFPTSDHVTCVPGVDEPVDHFFLLDRGTEFSIAPISREDARAMLISTIEERYCFTGESDHKAFHDFLGGLLGSTRLHRLTLSDKLEDLDKLVAFFHS